MKNLIIILILVAIAGTAFAYIYKAKKSGVHCVGCPHSKTCGSGNCSCKKEQE